MWDAQQLYNTRFHQECQQFFQYFFVLFAERFLERFTGRTSQSLTRQLPYRGEPLAKRESFPICQSLPSIGATATTAASGGNREELLGQRPAGCKRQRSRRWVPQPGQWQCEAMTERLSPARASRSGRPSSNLSVGLAPASSPSRGASGVSSKLHPAAKASPR